MLHIYHHHTDELEMQFMRIKYVWGYGAGAPDWETHLKFDEDTLNFE